MINEPHYTDFWSLWSKYLPVGFDKKKAKEQLSLFYGITERNVEKKLKDNKILTSDVNFMYKNLAITFDREKGFSFDQRQYELIRQNEEMECASMFGLSKSI